MQNEDRSTVALFLFSALMVGAKIYSDVKMAQETTRQKEIELALARERKKKKRARKHKKEDFEDVEFMEIKELTT